MISVGTMRLLNIGGHQQAPEKLRPKYNWIVVDINPEAEVVVDISNTPLPFDSESVSAIYCSHTLEHIDLHRLPFVLSEFYRVLNKNAKIRVVVPDLDIAINAYSRGDFQFLSNTKVVADLQIYPDLPLINLFSWAYSYCLEGSKKFEIHKCPFNQEVLSYFLRKAGFDKIYLKSWQNMDEVFEGMDYKCHRSCSLYMEAIK